jgi:dihydrofolate synthase / folylpolyglutamate synthase
MPFHRITVEPVQTRIFHAGENLVDFVAEAVPKSRVKEDLILAVTSKIVSLAEGRLVDRSEIDKASLVKQEADVFYGEVGYGCFLTIKHGLFIASAGIDESNSEGGEYILYPEDPFLSAKRLGQELSARWGIGNLGIILTDSHTTPLRRGVTGVGLAYWGFKPLRNLIGSKDLFGRELKMTQMNLVDGLSAIAVLSMGEGAESRPLALIEGADVDFTLEQDARDLVMPPEEDLYQLDRVLRPGKI